MNKEDPIFTPEQFRAQAAELSRAVTELKRRDEQCPDPHDPFSNPTEFRDYTCDYGEIVPQIRIPGCRIPLKPNKKEKKRICRFQNIVGGVLTGHAIVSNVLFLILMEIFILGVGLVDRSAGELPAGYEDIVMDYLYASSTITALTLLVYGLCNFFAAWLGCKATKIPISSLFQTKGFSAGKAVMYICIALFIQTATGYAAVWISDLLEGVGISLYEADFSTAPELKSTAVSIVYSVLVAPVTEELLMRGFVLKNLSRTGQRFGIIMSAFLFGIWHENISQFILAFAAGCFFGYLTVKHDSLVPAILCHMAVNGFAELYSIFDTYQMGFAYALTDIVYMLAAAAGLVLLVILFFRERMPQSTPHQTERCLRMTLRSPMMLVIIAIHIGAILMLIFQESGML